MDELEKIRLIENLENADPYEKPHECSQLCSDAAAALRAAAQREAELRDALEQIARMKIFPDDFINRTTLHAAMQTARAILAKHPIPSPPATLRGDGAA